MLRSLSVVSKSNSGVDLARELKSSDRDIERYLISMDLTRWSDSTITSVSEPIAFCMDIGSGVGAGGNQQSLPAITGGENARTAQTQDFVGRVFHIKRSFPPVRPAPRNINDFAVTQPPGKTTSVLAGFCPARFCVRQGRQCGTLLPFRTCWVLAIHQFS